jgi:hypothetical protein
VRRVTAVPPADRALRRRGTPKGVKKMMTVYNVRAMFDAMAERKMGPEMFSPWARNELRLALMQIVSVIEEMSATWVDRSARPPGDPSPVPGSHLCVGGPLDGRYLQANGPEQWRLGVPALVRVEEMATFQSMENLLEDGLRPPGPCGTFSIYPYWPFSFRYGFSRDGSTVERHVWRSDGTAEEDVIVKLMAGYRPGTP